MISVSDFMSLDRGDNIGKSFSFFSPMKQEF